jgi:hypothetical protein
MKEPEFDAAYRQAKRAAFSQSIARMHKVSSAAVSTLGKIMVDANSPASTRVRAADSILNHATKAIEIEDIAARVAALEEAHKHPGKSDERNQQTASLSLSEPCCAEKRAREPLLMCCGRESVGDRQRTGRPYEELLREGEIEESLSGQATTATAQS